MKYIKTLLGFLAISIIAIIITGFVLNYLGVRHGPLLIKIGVIFLSVNIVLYLLLLIIFVIKNLFTLYSEKRKKIIGARFRTTLVIAFVGLTLIPSILLFVLSNQLINNTIDKWFALEVQRPINDSMDIAKAFYLKERAGLQDYANMLALNRNISPSLNKENKTIKTYFLTKPDSSDLVKSAFEGIADTEIVSHQEGDVIRAVSPLKDGGGVIGVVLVETIITKDVVNKMESIKEAFNEYQQIETLQSPIKFIYFFILTVTTLFVIFLALWVALRISKGITIPIRSLAEATTSVADGNLDVRVNLKRDDEVGLLINSFNRMVEELKDSRFSLQKAYTESDRRRLSMEAMLENINTGVIFLERGGKIIAINKAARLMLNLDRNYVVGKSHKEILQKIQSEDLNLMINQIGEKGFKAIEKEIHANIEGRVVNLRVYITALRDSKGDFIGTLVVFDDLTKIIKAQRALAWQEVARRIAHEIKNPLTPIKLSTERIIKKWDERTSDFEDVLKKATNTIVKEVDSLRNLVDEFSKFGKMPKINLTPNNIRAIIEEVVNLYSDFKDVRILTSFQEIPEIEVDREQIKRVLINLIDNAIHADTKHIWLNALYEPTMELIRIEVIDDGIGIKDEDKDKLFLPYFSTKKEGTGLGLAIVDRIIGAHRGYIRIKDNEPKGTQFIIELPVSKG